MVALTRYHLPCCKRHVTTRRKALKGFITMLCSLAYLPNICDHLPKVASHSCGMLCTRSDVFASRAESSLEKPTYMNLVGKLYKGSVRSFLSDHRHTRALFSTADTPLQKQIQPTVASCCSKMKRDGARYSEFGSGSNCSG